MTRKKQKLLTHQTKKDLLIRWAIVIQHQQVWIAQIIQSLGAPLLPEMIEPIRRKLCVAHFDAWLDEGAQPELIEGLLAASSEERRIRTEIGNQLVGDIVRRLIDLRDGGEPSKTLSEHRAAFMIDGVKAKHLSMKFPPSEDNEDARSDAYLDAWEELHRQVDSVMKESWPLPVAENEFEARLLENWPRVLDALKNLAVPLLPALVATEEVNYIPARIQKDRIDRLRRWGAKKRSGQQVDLDKISDAELLDLVTASKSPVEDRVNAREALKHVLEAADRDGPDTGQAVRLVLRGSTQEEAAQSVGMSKSTLNERVIILRKAIKRSEI